MGVRDIRDPLGFTLNPCKEAWPLLQEDPQIVVQLATRCSNDDRIQMWRQGWNVEEDWNMVTGQEYQYRTMTWSKARNVVIGLEENQEDSTGA